MTFSLFPSGRPEGLRHIAGLKACTTSAIRFRDPKKKADAFGVGGNRLVD